jgi:hypothetical protein
MSGEGLASAVRFLVLALSILYVAFAVAGLMFFDLDTTREVAFWLGFLGGGAVLMLVGQFATPAGWLSAVLVSVGSAAGGLPLVWTVIVPVAVAAVVACTIALARQRTAPA